MNTILHRIASVAAMALLLALLAQPASARFIGDPAPDVKKGQMAVIGEYDGMGVPVKIDYPQTCGTGFFATVCVGGAVNTAWGWSHIGGGISYGISDTLSVNGDLSIATLNTGGMEFGGGAKMALTTMKLGGKDAKIAAFGQFHSGSATGMSWTDIDLGGGLSLPIDNKIRVYGGAFLMLFSGTIVTIPFSGTSPLSLYGGGSYAIDNKITVGGELHLLGESGFAFFGQYKL